MATSVRGSAVAAAIAIVASLGLVLTGTVTVAAGPPQARLSIAPEQGTAGSQAQIEGAGFTPRQAVEIRWGDTGELLAATTGPEFSTTVTIPADAGEGSHRLDAHGKPAAQATSGQRQAADSFTVTAEPVPDADGAAPGEGGETDGELDGDQNDDGDAGDGDDEDGTDEAADNGDESGASEEESSSDERHDAGDEDDDGSGQEGGETPERSSGAPEGEDDEPSRTPMSPEGDAPDEGADGEPGGEGSDAAGTESEPDGTSEEASGEATGPSSDDGESTGDAPDGGADGEPASSGGDGPPSATTFRKSSGGPPTAVADQSDELQPTAVEEPPDTDWAAVFEADAFQIQDIRDPVAANPDVADRRAQPGALDRGVRTTHGADTSDNASSQQQPVLPVQRLAMAEMVKRDGAGAGPSTESTAAVSDAVGAPGSQGISLVLLVVSGAVIIWHRRRLMAAASSPHASTRPSPGAHRR